VDSNGDGKADTASVFADGFKTAATGVGAGVLAHGGSVYYTCAPTSGDSTAKRAAQRQSARRC
jgi:hypothetical protein